jgi:subtilisin-like proprotein convertase family protein
MVKSRRMKHLGALLLVAACKFTPGAGAGDANTVDSSNVDAPLLPDAAPGTWIDDTAADFSRGAPTVSGATITPWGTVEPRAYVGGAWLAAGKDGALFTNETTADWTTLTGETGRAFLIQTMTDVGTGVPPSLGIPGNADAFTVWGAGELYLVAGTHQLALDVDDHGFFDVDLGGGYQRVVTAAFTAPKQQSLAVAAAGWYPIRYGWADTGGGARISLQHQAPGDAALAAVQPARMRANMTLDQGAMVLGFDEGYLTQGSGLRLWDAPLVDQDFGNGNPSDLGITNPDYWSARWTGQVRIEADGMYGFHLDTDDGHRLWIDGNRVDDHLGVAAITTDVAPLHLDPGWHDVAFDQMDATGAARAILHVASGPELVGAAFPRDRVRAVVTGRERLFVGSVIASGGGDTIPDQGQLTKQLAVALPADAVVNAVDYRIYLEHTRAQELTATLSAPDGTMATIFANQTGNLNGAILGTTDGFNGKHAGGTWTLVVADNTKNTTGRFHDLYVTIHYHTGSDASVEQVATFTSAPRVFPEPVHVTQASWATRQAAAANMTFELRGCAATCTTELWTAVPSNPGTVTGVSGIAIQYRATLHGDGTAVPALDRVTIETVAN